MSYQEVYKQWCTDPYFSEETRAELKSIEGNEKEIEDRFYKNLEFGTAGLRGVIGNGTNRMNIYTVRRASQGLANFIIKENGQSKGVAIAYDSRHMSPEFCDEAALCLNANGIKAYVFPSLRPTPELSFAVRHLGCIAGIVITASHNPSEYNGYKVYNEKGCQITEEAALAITEKIENASYFGKYKPNNSLIKVLDDRVMNAFLSEVEKLSLFDGTASFAPKIVYTPLNGTGYKPVTEILKRIGVKDLTVVPEQAYPDGDFPTCPYPKKKPPSDSR